MTRALITGIQGFVGQQLAKFLLAMNYEVYGFDVKLSNVREIVHGGSRINLFECDIRDGERVHEIVSQIKPDEIYHLAAIAYVPTSFRDPKLTFDVNLYGSLNLFEAIKAVSNSIKMLYIGSATEYGEVKEGEIPIDENAPLRPVDPYSVSKVSGDMLAFQYYKSFNMPIIRVRPFNHIGSGQSHEYVCSGFAKQIAEIEKDLKKPVIYAGNLEAKRDFTDVRDMVRAYWLAVLKGEFGEVYNICSGKAISIKEVLDKLLSMSTKDIKVETAPDKLRPSDVSILTCDSTRFRERTGWKQEITLDETLKSILDYWREKT